MNVRFPRRGAGKVKIGNEADVVRREGVVDDDGTHYGLVSSVDYIIQCVPTDVSGSVDTLNQAITVQKINDFGGGGVRRAVKMNVVVTGDDVGAMERVAVGQQIREFVNKGGVSQVILGVWRGTIQAQEVESLVGEGEGELYQFKGGVGEGEGGFGGEEGGERISNNKSNAAPAGLTGEGEGMVARGSDVTALSFITFRAKPSFYHSKDIDVVVMDEVR